MKFLISILYCSLSFASALIPASPQEQTRRAIASLSNAIASKRENNGKLRFYVDYLIPLPPETQAEDIDPWPGGLAQMYPYAEETIRNILQGIVDEPSGPCSSQVISEPDCSGFFIQESKTSAQNDVAAILFPGVDQLDNIEQIDKMVGDKRTLILFNKQFQRVSDFGFGKGDRCKKSIFDRFSQGFAFQEIVCRGEDTKLTFEYPNWQSCVICDEDVDIGPKETLLFAPQPERPSYESLTEKINEILPEPLWMRKMQEANTKGLKFQRDNTDKKS
uniref:DUF1995 domain-containing protein n=1 Tax=Corethron hystrix TaxID=216773 RepID=A0A7S1FTR5_9STRA|mmetsp:Transcript_26906/g.61941  ORF Transcript_26906/g.61941 Transcript_26906/m.61941 type:complete len:276 (+) Transcript_26906:159-986(+)